MSWQATSWADEQHTGSAARKATLQALANVADDEGYCWPSIARIAQRTEQSERTVQRHIRALEELGLLEREARARDDGSQSSNGYRLLMPIVGGDKLSPPLDTSDTPPRQVVTGGVTPVSPHEVAVEGRKAGSTAVNPSIKPPASPALPEKPRRERRDAIALARTWKRVRPTIQQNWHRGRDRIHIGDQVVGLGLEREMLGDLLALYRPDDVVAAIEAAPTVWLEGWPRSLRWFVSAEHGPPNFEEALGHANKQAVASSARASPRGGGPTKLSDIALSFAST